MYNERPHPSAFAGERLPTEGTLIEAEARTARINGLVIGYRMPPPKKASVLVVDDDHDNADSLSMLIRFWGHQVWTAYGGSAGLNAAAIHRPDVMCLDIGMPVMSGCELAQRLRRQARFKDTLLIAITGYADDKHRLLCEEAGFDAVLIKPLATPVLQRWLAKSGIGRRIPVKQDIG